MENSSLVEYWQIKGVFWRLKQGLKRLVRQVIDGLDTQKRQVGEDKQEVHQAKAFALADPGSVRRFWICSPVNISLIPYSRILSSKWPWKLFRAGSICP